MIRSIDIKNKYVLFKGRACNQNKSPLWILFLMFQNKGKVPIYEYSCTPFTL